MDYVVFIFIGVILTIFLIFFFFSIFTRLLWKVGPNEALIVYGVGRPAQVYIDGATFVIPGLQQAKRLSLEPMPIDISFTWRSFDASHESARIQATIVLKIKTDTQAVMIAAEYYLDKTLEERKLVLRPILEHHLRSQFATASLATFDQWAADPECAAQTMLEAITPAVDRLGLSIIAFTVKQSG